MTFESVIRRLSPDDMMQLASEASGARMQFAVIAALDGALDPETVRRLVESRIDAVPRLRQRLVRVPRGCGRPVWVDDPAFDLSNHLGVAKCPRPGDRQALLGLAARIVPTRLSLARPPWSLTLVTGLAGGKSALIIILHHVLADGLAGLAILSHLVDRTRPLVGPSDRMPPAGSMKDPTPRPSGPVPWPTVAELRADALAERRRTVRDLPRLPGRLRLAAAELFRGGTGTAPRCSINSAPVGRRRTLAVAGVDLPPAVAAAKAVGGTVNDVVLTAASGALAELLCGHGERLDRLVISVPISARPAAGAIELGNRVGVLPVSLPTSGEPRQRLATVSGITRSRKTAAPGASAELYGPFVRVLTGLGAFGWFIGHQRLVNTFVTNVRGPKQPLAFGGVQVEHLIPISPISGNVGVAFAAFSYAGRLTVTVVADPDLCPDVDLLVGALRTQLNELTGRSDNDGEMWSNPSPAAAPATGSASVS